MNFVILFVFFLFGIIGGIILCIGITYYFGKRALEKRNKEVSGGAAATTPKKVESIASRMKRVKEITDEQMDLQGQISMPQKNALHGKFKNGLMDRLKDLEDQKNEILRSIVADGFDPEITVMDEIGVVSNIKLSDFLAQNGIAVSQKTDKPSTKQLGKFTIYKGGKDDGSDNTSH